MPSEPSAPPLVLLHGLGTGPRGWAPQVSALEGTRPVVVPHLPPSLERAVSDVVRLLDARATADVCGLSLGGLVALRAAVERPARVRRLVVCAAFARLPPRLRALQRALAVVAFAAPVSAVRRGLTSGLPHEHRVAAEADVSISGRALARLMREGARFDVEHAARTLVVPTLVLCGSRDRHNLPLSRALADLLPNARLELVEGAGHAANLDQPTRFTEALERFLA